jgi:hypothetical protein
MSRKMLRVLAILALALVTFAGSGNAAALRAHAPDNAGLTAIWDSIGAWVRALQIPGLSAIWGGEGSQMDPNGTNPTGNSTTDPGDSTNSDEGSQMDPDGR